MQCTEKGDRFSSEFFLFNDQTSQILNLRITPYGVNVPSFTATEIGTFPTDVTAGTIWLNTTLNKLQFKTNTGTIETITST